MSTFAEMMDAVEDCLGNCSSLSPARFSVEGSKSVAIDSDSDSRLNMTGSLDLNAQDFGGSMGARYYTTLGDLCSLALGTTVNDGGTLATNLELSETSLLDGLNVGVTAEVNTVAPPSEDSVAVTATYENPSYKVSGEFKRANAETQQEVSLALLLPINFSLGLKNSSEDDGLSMGMGFWGDDWAFVAQLDKEGEDWTGAKIGLVAGNEDTSKFAAQYAHAVGSNEKPTMSMGVQRGFGWSCLPWVTPPANKEMPEEAKDDDDGGDKNAKEEEGPKQSDTRLVLGIRGQTDGTVGVSARTAFPSPLNFKLTSTWNVGGAGSAAFVPLGVGVSFFVED